MEENIEKNAKSFFGNTATVKIKNNGQQKIFEILTNSTVYKICVYYIKDGTTSLCSAGSPETHDMTDSFIQKISQDYCISDKKTVSFSIQNIDDDTFQILLDYFKTDIGASVITSKEENFYNLIQFKGTTGDLLSIKRYFNGNTQFQGKPLVLYTQFVFPILKGLEGYIRAIFKHFDISTDSKNKNVGSFFALNMKKFELNVDTRSIITDIAVQNSLGALYTLYNE